MGKKIGNGGSDKKSRETKNETAAEFLKMFEVLLEVHEGFCSDKTCPYAANAV